MKVLVHVLLAALWLTLLHQSCAAQQGSSQSTVKPVKTKPAATGAVKKDTVSKPGEVPIMYEKGQRQIDSLKQKSLKPGQGEGKTTQDIQMKKSRNKNKPHPHKHTKGR